MEEKLKRRDEELVWKAQREEGLLAAAAGWAEVGGMVEFWQLC